MSMANTLDVQILKRDQDPHLGTPVFTPICPAQINRLDGRIVGAWKFLDRLTHMNNLYFKMRGTTSDKVIYPLHRAARSTLTLANKILAWRFMRETELEIMGTHDDDEICHMSRIDFIRHFGNGLISRNDKVRLLETNELVSAKEAYTSLRSEVGKDTFKSDVLTAALFSVFDENKISFGLEPGEDLWIWSQLHDPQSWLDALKKNDAEAIRVLGLLEKLQSLLGKNMTPADLVACIESRRDLINSIVSYGLPSRENGKPASERRIH